MAADLPRKTELLVYHGMSALQKKYYKALLMKDRGEANRPAGRVICTWALSPEIGRRKYPVE